MNKAFQGAYRKGYRAALEGKPIEACPYVDWRKADGRLTFSRGFRRAWHDGYRAALAEKNSHAQGEDK